MAAVTSFSLPPAAETQPPASAAHSTSPTDARAMTNLNNRTPSIPHTSREDPGHRYTAKANSAVEIPQLRCGFAFPINVGRVMRSCKLDFEIILYLNTPSDDSRPPHVRAKGVKSAILQVSGTL